MSSNATYKSSNESETAVLLERERVWSEVEVHLHQIGGEDIVDAEVVYIRRKHNYCNVEIKTNCQSNWLNNRIQQYLEK